MARDKTPQVHEYEIAVLTATNANKVPPRTFVGTSKETFDDFVEEMNHHGCMEFQGIGGDERYWEACGQWASTLLRGQPIVFQCPSGMSFVLTRIGPVM